MRIAIVNDMPLAVEALRRALAFEPAHQVIWVAGDGLEAVRLCAEDTPDLILMDLIMPVMDGVEATRRIMAESPCAIVIVTIDREQNVHRVFEAMGFGALDVVDTPVLGGSNPREAAAPLLRKILNVGWLMGQTEKRVRQVAAQPRVQGPSSTQYRRAPVGALITLVGRNPLGCATVGAVASASVYLMFTRLRRSRRAGGRGKKVLVRAA